ncbi:MAG: hypothetical protein ACKO8V_02735 [Actinomycetota bacterium]
MSSPSEQHDDDPVVVRRNRIDRLNKVASRIGYGLYALSTAAFFAGLWTSYTSAMHLVSGRGVRSPQAGKERHGRQRVQPVTDA